MYFLYTALASCLDALQCLMRRLAGLDVYWQGGVAVTGEDPVLGFIFGILGIGDNAGAYSALSTVFWSLAIFGLIVLAVSTMIAIIKSHYNEDSKKTSPMTYVYTAFKSILTFAIVPFVVIVGFWLSQFMLSTLDNITSGVATSEAMQGIYGSEYSQYFKAKKNHQGKDIYTSYDFFGFGEASNSSTFSGLIFRAAGYDANRVRSGTFVDGKYDDFGIFGKMETPANQTYAEFVGYQVDYAFTNNLSLQQLKTGLGIYDATTVFITVPSIDAFSIPTFFIGSFSKYNVGLVWYFYNLWKFNFMVGFAAIIVCFGLFTSIIIGLISRIIKSVALFLIYPAILGIAPMDEWNGFKSWRKEFTSQILMAYGSIIGMNIFFLIVPYLNQISFFNIGLLDYLVNIIIVVTGLVMVKQLISFMSGLIGGGDANAVGGDLKKDVGGTMVKAGMMTAGAANIALKAGKFISPAGAALAFGKAGAAKFIAKKTAASAGDKATKALKEADNLRNNVDYKKAADKITKAEDKQSEIEQKFDNDPKSERKKAAWAKEAKGRGLKGEEADNFIAGKRKEALMKNKTYANAQHVIDNHGLTDQQLQDLAKADELDAEATEHTTRQKAIRRANYMDEETGNPMEGAFRQKLKNEVRGMTGALQKMFVETMPKNLGFNLNSLKGVFGAATNMKFDENMKRTGEYGESHEADSNYVENTKISRKVRRAVVGNALAGAVFNYGGGASRAPAEKTGEKAQKESASKIESSAKSLDEVASKLAKAAENLEKAARTKKP